MGAHAAALVPTTTVPPLRAAGQPSGSSVTGTRAAPSRATTCSARDLDGAMTSTPSAPIRCTSSSTRRPASRAGARRITEASDSPANAASTSPTLPPPGEGVASPGVGRLGSDPRRTTRPGDAVPRNDATGPAQRHAAHTARSRTEGGGPRPLAPVRSFGVTPGGASTLSATTQPPTLRPWRGMRTRDPKVT
jgi:hypothetical protein